METGPDLTPAGREAQLSLIARQQTIIARLPRRLDALGLDALGLDALGLDALGLDLLGLDLLGLDLL